MNCRCAPARKGPPEAAVDRRRKGGHALAFVQRRRIRWRDMTALQPSARPLDVSDPDEGRSLPAWTCRDPEHFQVEMARILRPSQQIVCHVSGIPATGDWHALDLLGDSIIVIRGDDGDVRAFANVCPPPRFPAGRWCVGLRQADGLPLSRMDPRTRWPAERRAPQGKLPRS